MKLLPNRMLVVLSHEEFVEVRRILLSLGYKWRKAGNYQNCIVSPSGKPVTDRDHSEYYMEPECLELVRSVGNAEDVLRQYQLPEPRSDLVLLLRAQIAAPVLMCRRALMESQNNVEAARQLIYTWTVNGHRVGDMIM
jgi:hypothetical protein